MTFVPRDLGGTVSGDGDNNEETDNEEDGESDADRTDMEDVNLNRFKDVISMVVGDGSAVYDASRDDAAATAEGAASE